MKQLTKSKTHLAAALCTALALTASIPDARADKHQKPMMDPSKMDHSGMDHSKMKMGAGPSVAKIGNLTINRPWARQSFGRAVNSAGFMIIDNKGTSDDLLIGARSAISKRTELHTHIRDGEIMRMRRVEGGIAVPKGGQAKLQSGGFHIMFIGLQKPLKKGDTFPLTLTFKQAGDVTFNIMARKMAMPKGMKMDHDKMHRGSHQ